MLTRTCLLIRPAKAACLIALLLSSADSQAQTQPATVPNLETMLAAKQDVWGLAAMREPNGPSYEFFEKLLPPLRYVDAQFRHYPIVLSAPNASAKARLISNGSGLNVRAGLQSWHEFAAPVTFRVGDDGEIFGADLRRLDGPHLERGYLPIVGLSYQHAGRVFEEEAFAAVEPELASNGVVFVRFTLKKGNRGTVSVRFDASTGLVETKGAIRGTNGLVLAVFDGDWRWQPERMTLEVQLRRGAAAELAIATKPFSPGAPLSDANEVHRTRAINPFPWFDYQRQRKLCADTWQSLLDRGTQIEVPEPRVNNAWRALVVSLFTLKNGDRLNYSAGNSYDRQYEAECGDAVRALLLLGHENDAVRALLPLLDYVQQGLRFHDAAFKLQMLSHYFWITRDTNFIAATRKQWQRETGYIRDGRESATGLLPRENYCGDIHTQVYSLNSSANSWRGLRDFAAMLEALGDSPAAKSLHEPAASFRKAILAAVEKSERRDVQPTFIPIALFGEEQPYDVLTDTRLGGYWCLMAPYLLGSGVFGPGAERERAIVDYLHEHGGASMGMIRFHQHSGLFANEDALDDLYGLRYTIKLLELDEVDRALASFYGKLAQGLTRNTFIGAEGTGLRPLDEFGRSMYLPPGSSSQAYFLWMLRYLLVQDWDADDDGRPDTLRLGFATSKRWLENGKTIKVERAPTAFGEVSLQIKSRLSRGEVVADLDLPTRNAPKQILLRIRMPDGWRVTSARAGKLELKVDERGTADVSSLKGRTTIRFKAASL